MTKNPQPPRSWLAVEFEVGARQEDLASSVMIHQGARGCEIKPLEGDRILVHAVFDLPEASEEHVGDLKACLEEYGLGASLSSLRIKTVVEDDWLAQWKQGFEPFVIGDGLLICPPWRRDDLSPDAVAGRAVILIEPGMAFGTGLHATTRYCLRALQRFPTAARVLDVGTGSGILAIAAAKLKSEIAVDAIDNDRNALTVAQENVELNCVDDRVHLLLGTTDAVLGKQYDLLLSNLTCEDIVALLPHYLQLTATGGLIVCAGILLERLPLLEGALEGQPLTVIDKEIDGHWIGMALRRD